MLRFLLFFFLPQSGGFRRCARPFRNLAPMRRSAACAQHLPTRICLRTIACMVFVIAFPSSDYLKSASFFCSLRAVDLGLSGCGRLGSFRAYEPVCCQATMDCLHEQGIIESVSSIDNWTTVSGAVVVKQQPGQCPAPSNGLAPRAVDVGEPMD